MQLQNVSINPRRFGQTGLIVSQFGLGCARLGGIFKHEPDEFEKILTTAFDQGITFFDTANIYSQGESEALLGRTLRRQRNQIVIASKAGYVLPSRRELVARLKPVVRPLIRALGLARHHLPGVVRGSMTQDFSPGHLRQSIEQSLRRLRTDRIDLFQLHSPSLETAASGDWIEVLEHLKQQGKIRHYGVSCDSVEASRATLRHPGVSSIQVPLNLLEREATAVLPVALAKGVGVIARECLANGLLARKMSLMEIRARCQSEDEAAFKAAQLERHQRAASDSGCTLTQHALRFVSRLEGVSVTLIGVSRHQQLVSLLANGIR
jgi:aryl-alcohol dehydrogenase-like predicted oxidoreductase